MFLFVVVCLEVCEYVFGVIVCLVVGDVFDLEVEW